MIKGIRTLHPDHKKQAAPLLLQHLEKVNEWHEHQVALATERNDLKTVMRHRRDIALILIGFWRAFRGDELARLQVENTQVEAGVGITFYLPQTKGDGQHLGDMAFHTPALKKLCPVDAYINWIAVAGIAHGPVFRKLDRWSNLAEGRITPNSLIPMLRRILIHAGIPGELYSSLSMRRGFSTWASANGWDIKSLMNYVGWKDVKSAAQYVDSISHFREPMD